MRRWGWTAPAPLEGEGNEEERLLEEPLLVKRAARLVVGGEGAVLRVTGDGDDCEGLMCSDICTRRSRALAMKMESDTAEMASMMLFGGRRKGGKRIWFIAALL